MPHPTHPAQYPEQFVKLPEVLEKAGETLLTIEFDSHKDAIKMRVQWNAYVRALRRVVDKKELDWRLYSERMVKAMGITTKVEDNKLTFIQRSAAPLVDMLGNKLAILEKKAAEEEQQQEEIAKSLALMLEEKQEEENPLLEGLSEEELDRALNADVSNIESLGDRLLRNLDKELKKGV